MLYYKLICDNKRSIAKAGESQGPKAETKGRAREGKSKDCGADGVIILISSSSIIMISSSRSSSSSKDGKSKDCGADGLDRPRRGLGRSCFVPAMLNTSHFHGSRVWRHVIIPNWTEKFSLRFDATAVSHHGASLVFLRRLAQSHQVKPRPVVVGLAVV